ncbi:hypothetical protein [Alistipes finegoldii]|uniref:hypothetical protein n=1 Tax=Alistipes finegoldii TaxID=214856 RepID=UPI0024946DD8|nr:hypothetical protein [Alistipes finegoldii]
MLRGERDFPHSGMQAFGRGCFPTFRIDDPARNKRRIAVGFQCFESQRTRNAFDQITSFGEKRDIEIPFGIPLRCLTLVTAAVSRDMHGCTEKIIGSRIAHKSGIGRQGVITAFGGHGQRQITCIDALPLPNPYPQRSGRRLVEGGLFHAPEFDIDVFAQRRPDMRRGIDHMGAKPNRISGHVIRFIGMHIHLFLWKDLGLGGQIMNGPLLVSGNRLSRNTADRQQRDRQKKKEVEVHNFYFYSVGKQTQRRNYQES